MRNLLFALALILSAPAYAADAEPTPTPPAAAEAPTVPPSLEAAKTALKNKESEIPVVMEIAIEDAYAFATTPAQKSGAAFFTISNNGTVDDRLTAASSEVAASTDLHTNVIEEDTVTMTKVDGYDIPKNDILTLDPAGHHIMLNDLKQSLKEGDKFPLQLTFAKKGVVTVEVTVRAAGDKPVAAEPEQSINDDSATPAQDHEHHH